MKRNRIKKLNLNKETLRTLKPPELARAHGGALQSNGGQSCAELCVLDTDTVGLACLPTLASCLCTIAFFGCQPPQTFLGC